MQSLAISDSKSMLEQDPEWQKARRGELFHAWGPQLVAARDRCAAACEKFNNTSDRSRRNLVKIWREITLNPTPLPPAADSSIEPGSNSLPPSSSNTAAAADDDALFQNDPLVAAPIHIDYGLNVYLGPGVQINFNCTFIDTCPITIGAHTLVAPNCSFFAGGHPIDPAVRLGMEGPEMGKPITVGEGCWIGGNAVILPGVNIGKGSTVGAGSVVTKDVPPFHVVAGNPARILRKIETTMADQELK